MGMSYNIRSIGTSTQQVTVTVSLLFLVIIQNHTVVFRRKLLCRAASLANAITVSLIHVGVTQDPRNNISLANLETGSIASSRSGNRTEKGISIDRWSSTRLNCLQPLLRGCSSEIPALSMLARLVPVAGSSPHDLVIVQHR
jgi:hypothetical protein